jgi:hypothetical protein
MPGYEKRGRVLLETIRSRLDEILLFLFGGPGNTVDRTAAWTGAIGLVTAVAAIAGFRQLWNIRRTSRADFTKRFIDSFLLPTVDHCLPCC